MGEKGNRKGQTSEVVSAGVLEDQTCSMNCRCQYYLLNKAMLWILGLWTLGIVSWTLLDNGNLSNLSVSDLECYLFSVQIQMKGHQESLREMCS